MIRQFLMAIFLFSTSGNAADLIATTQEGKKVLLRENGTWCYLDGAECSQRNAAAKNSLMGLVKNDRSFDFRKIRWGMSRKEVIASEQSAPVASRQSEIEFSDELLGYECSVTYAFANDNVTRAELAIRQPHIDPSLYFKDYEDLRENLKPLYGNAVSDRFDWKNEIYRSDRSKWGFAVSLGFLSCITRWQDARTDITLFISGGNHQITTRLEYTERKKR